MLPRLLVAIAAIVALSGFGAPEKYAVGQVWEYQTRTGDEGSLLKIHRIEPFAEKTVFHVSVIGVHYGRGPEPKGIGHLPVSQETLDRSVTRLSDSRVAFPDPAEGIEIWRRDEGGMFTIPMSEIVQIVADTVPTD